MIHFINVSKVLIMKEGGKRPILGPTMLSIPTNARVGIWDEEGATTKVLLELITGALPVTEGRIVRSARLSPPMMMKKLLQPKLSGLDNIAFVARIYGEDIDKTIDLVDKFSELGSDLEKPVRNYDGAMQARLGVSICFSVPFDCYLAENNILVGPKWFKEKCQAFLQGPGANTGIILVSSRANEIRKHCEAFLIYRNLTLVPAASLENSG